MIAPDPFYARGDHFAIDLNGAHVVFTTRRGGASTGPYESMNLGRLTDDRPEAVRDNRASLQSQLGITLAHIRQVHGTDVRRVTEQPVEPDDPDQLPRVDGRTCHQTRISTDPPTSPPERSV